jgi:outer membrane lipoprotein-sorting protein
MTILTIEAGDRSHDAFVYLPSLQKVRRVGTGVRGDSLFGTDVTYEDLERRRVQEYELNGLGTADVRGEPAYLITARPRRDFNYDRVVFAVARSDWVILETRYFKRGEESPFRVITAPRHAMVAHDGHVIPTRLTVRNHARGTSTEVTFNDLRINPPIDDHLFSLTALERKRKLPIPAANE